MTIKVCLAESLNIFTYSDIDDGGEVAENGDFNTLQNGTHT